MKYTLTNHQVSSTIGNEVMILNHKDGLYYSMDEVGLFVWEQLQTQPYSMDELVMLVCENYDTTPLACQTDIEKLLDELQKEKLILQVQ